MREAIEVRNNQTCPAAAVTIFFEETKNTSDDWSIDPINTAATLSVSQPRTSEKYKFAFDPLFDLVGFFGEESRSGFHLSMR